MKDEDDLRELRELLQQYAEATAEEREHLRKSGSIDAAITSLEKASRRAGDVGDPRATELANFANALAPALETVQLVAMCLGDLSHE
jgi:hypothetical protein